MRYLILLPAFFLIAACSKKEVPPVAGMDAVVVDIQDFVDSEVATGFRKESEIIETVMEIFAEDHDPKALRRIAIRYTRQAIAEQIAEEKNWPKITDCDKLDAAFASLEKSGIVCRQDFTCCGTCGAGEIWDEIEKADRPKGKIRGYAFYHSQDTESAVDGGNLYLNYGATEEGEAAALRIAHKITAAFKSQGLRVDWDGTWGKRIGVKLDWKRRQAL